MVYLQVSLIDLIMVVEAILTGRQPHEKLSKVFVWESSVD